MINIKKSTLLSSLLLTSCFGNNKKYYPLKQCGNQDANHTKYQKCDLNEVSDYYDVIVDNGAKSNKVILYVYGGPLVSSLGEVLKVDQVQSEYKLQAAKKAGVSFYLMNQSQYLKQNKFLDGNIDKLTDEDGYKEHIETVDNIQKVIKHLKSQGKKVLLAGHSYGGFVVNEYLSKYGDDTPDFVLSVGARLKIGNAKNLKEAFNQAFIKYHANVFIGQNDAIIKYDTSQTYTRPKKLNFLNLMHKLGVQSLLKDYTKTIKDKDLSKTTFLTAELDQLVGWFNQEEINFARTKKAKIEVISKVEVEKIYQKSHPGEKIDDFTIRDLAHEVGAFNLEQALKYYISPFNK